MAESIRARVVSRAHEILEGCIAMAPDERTKVYGTYDFGSSDIPDVVAKHYKGAYWRDLYYTVIGFGDAFPHEGLEASLRYLLEPEVGQVEVPGYHPTDEIVFHKCRLSDGSVFWNYQFPWQTPYSADNPMFAMMLLGEYVRRGGDITPFAQHAERLELAISSVHLSDRYLVHHFGPYVYGFYDTINLSGEQTHASILYLNAAEDFAALYEQIGNEPKRSEWMRVSERIRTSLPALLSPTDAMFLSDLATNRRLDVWASAYAVYSGAADDRVSGRISEWFVDHYQECVRDGHVRQVPKPDNWVSFVGSDARGSGFYQNGGYWSVASPWVIRTLARSNPELAKTAAEQLARAALVYDFPECINEDRSCRLPDYTASAGMTLLALRIADEI